MFGNLECVLCDAGTPAEKEITLRASPARAEYLREAGFTIVSLANNHVLDFGSTGLAQTCSALREAGHSIRRRRRQNLDARIPDHRVPGLEGGFPGLWRGRCLPGSGRHFRQLHPPLRHPRSVARSQATLRCADRLAALGHRVRALSVARRRCNWREIWPPKGPILCWAIIRTWCRESRRLGSSLIVYSLGSFHIKPLRGEGTRQSCMLHARISKRGVERYRLIPVQLDDENAAASCPRQGQERGDASHTGNLRADPGEPDHARDGGSSRWRPSTFTGTWRPG